MPYDFIKDDEATESTPTESAATTGEKQKKGIFQNPFKSNKEPEPTDPKMQEREIKISNYIKKRINELLLKKKYFSRKDIKTIYYSLIQQFKNNLFDGKIDQNIYQQLLTYAKNELTKLLSQAKEEENEWEDPNNEGSQFIENEEEVDRIVQQYLNKYFGKIISQKEGEDTEVYLKRVGNSIGLNKIENSGNEKEIIDKYENDCMGYIKAARDNISKDQTIQKYISPDFIKNKIIKPIDRKENEVKNTCSKLRETYYGISKEKGVSNENYKECVETLKDLSNEESRNYFKKYAKDYKNDDETNAGNMSENVYRNVVRIINNDKEYRELFNSIGQENRKKLISEETYDKEIQKEPGLKNYIKDILLFLFTSSADQVRKLLVKYLKNKKYKEDFIRRGISKKKLEKAETNEEKENLVKEAEHKYRHYVNSQIANYDKGEYKPSEKEIEHMKEFLNKQKEEKEPSKDSLTFKFKDGTVIECINNDNKTRKEVLAEAKKLYKQFKKER